MHACSYTILQSEVLGTQSGSGSKWYFKGSKSVAAKFGNKFLRKQTRCETLDIIFVLCYILFRLLNHLVICKELTKTRLWKKTEDELWSLESSLQTG